MRMRVFKAMILLGSALIFASCASMQRTRDESGVALFTRLINTGRAETLASMSAVPFLVDQEIVSIPEDVNAFWRALVESRFTIGEASLTMSSAVNEASSREFADTVEVKAFFAKYVAKGTRLLELSTAEGKRILLLVHDEPFGRRTIRGFKGPFQP